MRVLATASAGTNRLLASECSDLGLRPRRVPAHGVELDLDHAEIARALVHLSIAQRVLIHLTRFPCDGADSLYDGARAVPWADWLDARQTLAVAGTGPLPKTRAVAGGGDKGARSRPLTNHVFASQVVKDAIVDVIREQVDARPNVDIRDPDLRVVARFHGDACSLWLDPGGSALHRRGYRSEAGEAPLRETLAAAVVRASGWQADRPLRDPMCGSGTLLIEAVGAALGLAPGRNRQFAAERWRHRDAELGAEIAKARDRARTEAAACIASARVDVRGADIDANALDQAAGNLRRAGLKGLVQLRKADARNIGRPPSNAVLISNPPYGERLGGDEVLGLYAALGRHWRRFVGCEAHLIDGHDGFERAFGMRWTDALPLTNGSLPVVLRRYEIR